MECNVEDKVRFRRCKGAKKQIGIIKADLDVAWRVLSEGMYYSIEKKNVEKYVKKGKK